MYNSGTSVASRSSRNTWLLLTMIGNNKILFFPEEGPTGKSVSFVLPVKGRPDVLLIGHGRDMAAVKWPKDAPDSSSAKAVSFASIDAGKKTRFNDGKCDPQGRILAGDFLCNQRSYSARKIY